MPLPIDLISPSLLPHDPLHFESRPGLILLKLRLLSSIDLFRPFHNCCDSLRRFPSPIAEGLLLFPFPGTALANLGSAAPASADVPKLLSPAFSEWVIVLEQIALMRVSRWGEGSSHQLSSKPSHQVAVSVEGQLLFCSLSNELLERLVLCTGQVILHRWKDLLLIRLGNGRCRTR